MTRLDPLPAGEVAVGLKRLLAYVVARVHGCHY